jgi:release factor glutamine methyltransferase
MTIGELVRKGMLRLKDSDIDNYAGEARDLIMFLTGYNAAALFMHDGDEVSLDLSEQYDSMIDKRCTHYPIQYLMGETCFMGYNFKCRENVLIPRFDTENLVEAAVESVKDRDSLKVLDMCTGTGCIGLSFYMERLKQGVRDKVTLADISDHALSLARDNRDSFSDIHIEDIEVIKTDLFSELEGRRYDVLLSNPPYIPTEVCDELEKDVRDFEPRLALDGDRDGLSFYRRIISGMKDYLSVGAVIFMEIGCEQFEDVKKLMMDEGYGYISLIKDLSGLDRVVSCRNVI